MAAFDNEPLLRYPEDLQRKKRDLRSRKSEIEAELKKIDDEIRHRRSTCAHKAIPGTRGTTTPSTVRAAGK